MARRIDDSHHSFKRSTKLGPGPKKRTNTQELTWECQKGRNTSTHYVQVCRYVGDDRAKRGKKITVKRSKAKKKAYNKLFRRWAKRNRRLQAMQAKPSRRAYKCRKTTVAKCK